MAENQVYYRREILKLFREDIYISRNSICDCLASSQTAQELGPIHETLDLLVAQNKLESFKNKNKGSKTQLMYMLKE